MTLRQRLATNLLRRRVRRRARLPPRIGVGMPAWLKLNLFGKIVRDAFPGVKPYLVGSAARSKRWRDVDVRVILTPLQWRQLFDGESEGLANASPVGSRRVALELAFAALGREMTGLPIDFQFMSTAMANRPDHDGPRVALGVEVEHPTAAR